MANAGCKLFWWSKKLQLCLHLENFQVVKNYQPKTFQKIENK